MNKPATGRLQLLSKRYASGGEVPAGEAFYGAFSRYMKANRESLLDITMTATAAHLTLGAGPEGVDPLLLKAVYDTNPSLTETRLFGFDEAALQGAVNTAKGKYFEYLVVEKLNNGEQVGPLVLQDGQRAVLAESMTQPGWDLQIVDSHGAVVEYLQLKATDSVGYVQDALERYPDFQILATQEVGDSHLVLDSGLSDQTLREQVGGAVEAADASLMESFMDYFNPLLPLAAIATLEGYRVAVGKQSVDSFKLALARRGQRVVASNLAGAAGYMLCGGLWAVPAAFAGGLWFDRVINQTAILNSFSERKQRLLSLRLMQQQRALAGAFQ